jgi:hypothetical protein
MNSMGKHLLDWSLKNASKTASLGFAIIIIE